ncbi:MAG: shikimate dehydrogenase [Kangiellaceae bacterium]|nr:shikimate dehydrogenase [Kangiellaceae bacterium]
MSTEIINCGVIGNPIEHSLSPEIHTRFANQMGIALNYQKYLLQEPALGSFVENFFKQGGAGLNVTAPFKKQVISSLAELSESAKLCNSVNTISINSSGELYGDTTDGPGIMLDLERLNYYTKARNVLILGAGGATIPVALALLKNGCQVSINNRTISKVFEIKNRLSGFGEILPFESDIPCHYDGVISAVSHFNSPMLQAISSTLKPNAFIYDLNYSERSEKTLQFFSSKGFTRTSDGYGMLVGQAAKSFEIWHGLLPSLGFD